MNNQLYWHDIFYTVLVFSKGKNLVEKVNIYNQQSIFDELIDGVEGLDFSVIVDRLGKNYYLLSFLNFLYQESIVIDIF